ncbi:hypothetical protein PRZ48_009516 [Zasmidium cellare]|uniref:BED-type domain-containing protein n=1 Tax=Zasmidium cellare TaxID=395010 RepID=A0ABR0ECB1_ZASCE|nr:hypothetical protein PRZ48_009516 [Zasmidium cellare]
MPCDIKNHSHEWPPSDSIMAAFFRTEKCETVCGYCPTTCDGRDLRRYTNSKNLQRHVREQHVPDGADLRKEIEAHQELLRVLKPGATRQQTFISVRDEKQAQIKLKVCHDALFVRMDRRDSLQALATRHLRDVIKEKTPFARGSSAHHDFINSIAISFTNTHGPAIWSNSADKRSHIAKSVSLYDETWTKSKNMRSDIVGPICTTDICMLGSHKRLWKIQHKGVELTNDVELLNSPFGIVIKDYFAALFDLVGENEEEHELTAQKSEAELLLEVIKDD